MANPKGKAVVALEKFIKASFPLPHGVSSTHMDPLEEFLSPEALRLLLDSDDFATAVDEPSVTTSDQSLSIITPLAAGADTPISNESKPTRKRPSSDANITGCSTLVLGQAGLAKPKRAKFSAEGRAKVASVRKKGACMKCHRNKIPVREFTGIS